MNAVSVRFQYAHSAWNSSITQKYVLLRQDSFKFLMAVTIPTAIFCVVMLCGRADGAAVCLRPVMGSIRKKQHRWKLSDV
jgi:hypothetical protein